MNGNIPEKRFKMKYKILAQFVNSDAKFDSKAQSAVNAGISNYNSKSLIAKNPKNIAGYSFSDDEMTLEIILESDEELPMPSKALRLLSTYLVNKTCIGEGNYLAGKQLFKMISLECDNSVIIVNNKNERNSIKENLKKLNLANQIHEMMIRDMQKDAKFIDQITAIMRKRDAEDCFEVHPGTPLLNIKGDYRCSVHYGNTYRLEKAKKQIGYDPVPTDTIIKYVNEFLESVGMTVSDYEPKTISSKIDYTYIKKQCGLADERDIIWLKFTQDSFVGVVATSNDINFDIPKSSMDYDLKKKVYNQYYKCYQYPWAHNTSGILVHQLNKVWDESFVLIFPLINIPVGMSRQDIERAVGNYLIHKKVPIIDFYSHNY